jgi:hypothetical protein
LTATNNSEQPCGSEHERINNAKLCKIPQKLSGIHVQVEVFAVVDDEAV